MKLDRSKVYGFTHEELNDSEISKLNITSIDGFKDVLTPDEIYKHFPNQYAVVQAVECDKYQDLFGTGRVVKYHADLKAISDLQMKHDNCIIFSTFTGSEDSLWICRIDASVC